MSPSAGEIRTWYNRRYAAHGAATMRPAEAYAPILELLEPRPGATLLDVSCGTGHLLAAASARGLQPVGVDLSEEAVRIARGTAPQARLAVCRGEALPLAPARFDYLTCLGSLEHFVDIEAGLGEMRRVVRSGGRLVIMVPNRRFLGWWFLGRRGTAQQDINETLLTLSEWRARFRRAGLEELALSADPWQARRLRSRSRGNLVERWLGWIAGHLWRLLPLGLEYQFLFLLRPRATASE